MAPAVSQAAPAGRATVTSPPEAGGHGDVPHPVRAVHRLRCDDRASGHLEGVVPQGLAAGCDLLAEVEPEAERIDSVVALGHQPEIRRRGGERQLRLWSVRHRQAHLQHVARRPVHAPGLPPVRVPIHGLGARGLPRLVSGITDGQREVPPKLLVDTQDQPAGLTCKDQHAVRRPVQGERVGRERPVHSPGRVAGRFGDQRSVLAHRQGGGPHRPGAHPVGRLARPDPRSGGVGPGPAGYLAEPVGVDGLDAVHVPPLGVDGVVDIGGVRGAGVGSDRPEGSLGVDALVAPQDHVAGDAAVAGVVPTQRDRVVGHLCGQPDGLGGPAGRRFGGCGGVGAHPGGYLAGAVGVDGLDAVHVAPLGVHIGAEPSKPCAGSATAAAKARVAMAAHRKRNDRLPVRAISPLLFVVLGFKRPMRWRVHNGVSVVLCPCRTHQHRVAMAA